MSRSKQPGKLVGYFRPTHDYGTTDVQLNWATIIGGIGSGKTVTIKTIFRRIREAYPDFRQVDIISNLPALFEIERDPYMSVFEDKEVLNIFIDDAAFGASSKAYKAKLEASWLAVRHHFEQVLHHGATVNLVFAVQSYTALQKTMRQAPLLLFKAMPLRDYRERKIVGMYTKGKTKELDRWTYEIYMRKNSTYKGYTIVCPPAGAPWIYRNKAEPIRKYFVATSDKGRYRIHTDGQDPWHFPEEDGYDDD